ncbi:MAG: hypothetical protein ACM3U2_19380 [Deltaproteobacteria bacterium]
MNRFLVTTPGLSATRWLSFVLASHPNVYVAHGKHSLESVMHGQFDRERQQGDTASLALGNVMNDFYRCQPLAAVFDIYRHMKPDARAWGNVHTYTLSELLNRFDPAADLAGIAIVNVLRHPVSYIASHTALARSARAFPSLHAHYRGMFDRVLTACPELLLVKCRDLESFRDFSVSCFSAGQILNDLRCDHAPHLRMEELTSDVDRLAWFCEHLTGLIYGRDRLVSFVKEGPINSHRGRSGRKMPAEICAEWEDWQYDAVDLLLSEELFIRFEAAGYDVSMLRPENRPRASLAGPAGAEPPKALADLVGLPEDAAPQLSAFADRPVLVEEGCQGFNIVRYEGRHIALAQTLGAVDLQQVDKYWLAERCQSREVLIAASLIEVRREIHQAGREIPSAADHLRSLMSATPFARLVRPLRRKAA